MTISTRFPRVSQPQDPTSIQRKYITSREENIVTLVGTDISNMPSFAPGGVASAPTKIINKGGAGLLFSGAQGLRATAPIIPAHDYAYVVVVRRGPVVGTDQWIFGLSDSSASVYKKLHFTSTDRVGFTMRDSGTTQGVSSSSIYPSGSLLNIVLVSRGIQDKRLFINGVLEGTNIASSKTGGGSDMVLGVQGSTTSQTSWLNGDIYLAAILPSVSGISDAAFMELSANPWQLFAPIEKPLFSAIDSVRIRGPKPRQVVRTKQPVIPLTSGISGILANFVTAVPNRLIYDSGLSAYYPTEFSYGETKSRGGLGVGTPQTYLQPIFGTSNSSDFSFCVKLDLVPGATADSSIILGNPNYSSGSELGIGHRRVDATTVRLWLSYYVGAQQRCLVIADFIGSAQYNKTVFFVKSGTDVSILMDGVVLASTTITIHQESGQKFRFNEGWGAWAKQAPISFAGYTTRALTLSDMNGLSRNPWQLFANAEQPFWHTELVQPKKFFPVLALPVPKSITANSVTPQVTLSF